MNAPAWLIPTYHLVAAFKTNQARTIGDGGTSEQLHKEKKRRARRKWWFGPAGKAWRERSRAHIRKRVSAWRALNMPRIRERERQWRQRNLERVRHSQREYYYANYEKRRAYLNAKQREYRAKAKL